MSNLIVNFDQSMKEVDDGNQVIANFIGLEKQLGNKFAGKVYLYTELPTTELYFHSNFEWLMTVLDTIERFGYDTSIIRQKSNGEVLYTCRIRQEGPDAKTDIKISATYKLTAIWHAVVMFCSDFKHAEYKISSSNIT